MNILWFNEIKKENIDLVGKKALDLSELYIKGLPIPPGFIITTELFKNFLDFSGIRTTILELMNNLDIENNEKLNDAVEKIQNLILKAPVPDYIKEEILEEYSNLNVDPETFNYAVKALDIIKAGRDPLYVALRPSIINGLDAETFLDVRGNSSLVDSIKKCWASSYNRDLVYHRAKNSLPHDSLIAVIVQKQIQPDKSGLILVNKNEITIKANFGSSETTISNLVTPDIYVIDKNNFLIKEVNIGSKEFMTYFDENIKRNLRKRLRFKAEEQVLNDSEINKLADISIKLEDFYEKPYQIEFAIRSGSTSILNLNPVEDLEIKEEIKIEDFTLETITKIKIDLEEPNDSDKAAATNADGVFIKLESIIKKRNISPMNLIQENEYYYISFLIEEIEKVTKSFRNKDVWIKTSDIIDENEKNPLIGWRGIRRALDENIVLKAEFNAIKKINESGYEKIKIVLPFITNINELKQTKDLMREVGIDNDIGIMLDTPSSCEIIDNFCKEGIKFIVFEVDNLTQLMLGVDRFNNRTAKLFNEKHPAILRSIQKVVNICRQFNVETSLVGKVSIDPEIVDFLVNICLDSIIISMEDVDKVRNIISRAEKRLIVK